MILNIVTFISCLLLLILFRRIDKSNAKMTKLRRYAKKSFDDFRKLADDESRKFRDATIEMDILIKKSDSLTTNLSHTLSELEKRIETIESEKDNLGKVEEDIKVVTHAAREVNHQIEFIAGAKDDFKHLTKKIQKMQEDIETVRGNAGNLIQTFENRLRDRSRELSEELQSTMDHFQNQVSEREDQIMQDSLDRFDEFQKRYSRSVESMEENLQKTSSSILQQVEGRVEQIQKTLDEAAGLQYQLDTIRETVSDLDNRAFSDIKEKSDELNQNVKDSVHYFNKLRSSINESVNQDIGELRAEMENLSSELFSALKDRSSSIKEDIQNSVTEFHEEKASMMESTRSEIDSMNDKIRAVEENISTSKQKLIRTFEQEVERIRSEFDNLSIHAISKKDEIVQATRREAEEIQKSIENFEERYQNIENRLVNTAEEKMDHLDSEFQSIELRISSLSERLSRKEEETEEKASTTLEKSRSEFSLMEDRLKEIRDSIMEYEKQNRIFSRSDDMIQQVEQSIQYLGGILQESKEEARALEKYFTDIEDFRELRKVMDKEIRAYQARKDNLLDVESEIRGLLEISDIAQQRADHIQQNISKIDSVNTRIEALSESYDNLDARIAELSEYEEVISKNLESVNRSEIVSHSIEGKLSSFQKAVDRTEKRVDKLNQSLRQVEESTLVLKSRERDIQEVQDRFNEIEGLLEHLEERYKQINAMFQKVESLKYELNTTDDRLQEMFQETDLKMKQFADFIRAVDKNSPITKEVKGDLALDKNITDGMIKTIRELSNKGWEAPQIAAKLMVDENSVRLIINTTSM